MSRVTASRTAGSQVSIPMLDTDVLRTFVTIAECGSFTRAARQVFRTPSALSMQIKRLEEMLGQTLFVRSEEHTSELQSRGQLVCRLLLEKIKNIQILDKVI